MVVYLIETQTEGLPAYYDPAAGRNTGHGIHGWTTEKNDALGFAAARDAQRFIDALLPRMANTCRPVPHQRGD